jgi:DNA-binding LacI/PurR family transcriptional regulator
MPREHFDGASGLVVAIAMFNGIYKRVAAKTGVHQTMVSRVARGQRNSFEVAAAIREELRAIRDYLNHTPKATNGG